MNLSRTTLAAVTGTTDPVGGAEKAFVAIVKGLRDELGMKLRVFSHLPPREPNSDFDVTVLRPTASATLGRMFLNLRRELLALEGPAVLFPFQINPNMLAVGVNQSLPSAKRLPTILNDRACIDEILALREGDPVSRRLRAPVVRRLARLAYCRADHIVCNARANEQAVLSFTGRDASGVSTIYNPLAADAIQARFVARDRSVLGQPTSPLIATHARMDRQKGLDILLRSFAVVRGVYPGARLRVVGDGPEREALEALAHELGIGACCEFPGFLSDPLSAIEGADVYVLSSRWEGLPNSLLEALAVGLPVVATRCRTGPDEILENGHVGLLVEVDDVGGMAESIRVLIDDADRRELFAERARRRALDFNLERNVSAYGEVLERAVGAPSSR